MKPGTMVFIWIAVAGLSAAVEGLGIAFYGALICSQVWAAADALKDRA